MRLAEDFAKACGVVLFIGVLVSVGWLAFATYLSHYERNNTHGYWLLVRAEGHWIRADEEHEPSTPERLSIELDSISVGERAELPHTVPIAKGSVAWSDGSCPVTLQLGTPNNPGIPDLWVEPSGAWVNSPFPWNFRERGFAASLQIVDGEPRRHPRETDPASDRLFVVFNDHVLQVGENRVDDRVCYVRDAR